MRLATLLLISACSDYNLGSEPSKNSPELDSCSCSDTTLFQGELDRLTDQIEQLSATVDVLEEELSNTTVDSTTEAVSTPTDTQPTEEDPLPAPSGFVPVISSYQVDCNHNNLSQEAADAQNDWFATYGSWANFQKIYSTCPLVEGIDGMVPMVTVYQVRDVMLDAQCDATGYCPNTSANLWWYNSLSGGLIIPGGWDDFQMSPGMQLRYDENRGIIHTSVDRRAPGPSRPGLPYEPLYYQVTVIGDKSYTAPTGWY
jgi:hypothetical protein